MKFTRLVSALAVAVAVGAPAYAQQPAATPPAAPPPAATPPSAQPANGTSGTVNLPTTLPGTPQTSPAIPNPRAGSRPDIQSGDERRRPARVGLRGAAATPLEAVVAPRLRPGTQAVHASDRATCPRQQGLPV